MRDEDTAVEGVGAPTPTLPERASAAVVAAYVLVLEGGTSSVFQLPPHGEVVVGRGELAQLKLSDQSVSRAHFKLLVEGAAVQVADLGSQNGTRLNGVKIVGARPMVSGDVITIGTTTLVLHASGKPRPRRVVLSLEMLRPRVEEEIDRAAGGRRGFALIALVLGSPDAESATLLDAVTLLRRVDGELRRHDALAQLGPDVVAALLPEVDAQSASSLATQVVRAIRKDAPHARAGVAMFPTDGVDVDTLLLGARAAAEAAPAGAVHAAAATFKKLELGSHQLLVADPAMLRVVALVERLAKSDLAVLVTGETGTGKELIAAAVHAWSRRKDAPLISWNCAALTESLAESELFGHEKGAFTGAGGARAGLLEAGDGGTLFCDEIGELPLAIQAKLLRALETKRIVRVGSTQEREVDFRLVAATNRDLGAEVKAGKFREDLLYRIGGATVWLPPLRDRRREIPLLAQAFVAAACTRAGRDVVPISDEAMGVLLTHLWPGNVRELRQVLDYAIAAHPDEPQIAAWHLTERLRSTASPPPPATLDLTPPPQLDPEPAMPPADGMSTLPERFTPLEDEVRDLERTRMTQALAVGGSQAAAAELLKMPLRTFQAKAKSYGLRKKDRD